MATKTHGERIDRLEKVIQILAEDQVSLQKLIAELSTATRQGFDELKEQSKETERRFRETDERFRETDERFRRTDERFRRTDERIDKLVVAIGEFIRKQA